MIQFTVDHDEIVISISCRMRISVFLDRVSEVYKYCINYGGGHEETKKLSDNSSDGRRDDIIDP